MTDKLQRRTVEIDLTTTDGRACRCGAKLALSWEREMWFPTSSYHPFTHSLAIMTHMPCCGRVSHTEPVASVFGYLRDVKGNAQLVCNAVNQHRLMGRPEPEWLTVAWAEWESAFEPPANRSQLRP